MNPIKPRWQDPAYQRLYAAANVHAGGDTLFRLGMLPDPPPASWYRERAGYAAKHFTSQIFYRIRLKEGKA